MGEKKANESNEAEFLVRRMEERDLEEVAEIEKGIFTQPWTRDGFYSSMISKDTIYLVVENNAIDNDKKENVGRICGYCGLLQALDEADITNVAVRESARGKKIGYRMLTELMRLGEERGITAFTLEVRKSNAPALALYEKLGFETAGIRKNFYDFPKEDAVIMWKYRKEE